MRWAAKRDANEPEIVKALERAGWLVMKVSDKGAPDLLCARKGRLVLVEVKGPKGKLTPAQVESHARLSFAGVTVHVVTTPEEALMAVGAPVEVVLGPLDMATIRKAFTTAREGGDLSIPIHPNSIAGRALRAEVKAKGHVDVEEDQIAGHVVTPAYQREQTEAVVPKKRPKKASKAALAGILAPVAADPTVRRKP